MEIPHFVRDDRSFCGHWVGEKRAGTARSLLPYLLKKKDCHSESRLSGMRNLLLAGRLGMAKVIS